MVLLRVFSWSAGVTALMFGLGAAAYYAMHVLVPEDMAQRLSIVAGAAAFCTGMTFPPHRWIDPAAPPISPTRHSVIACAMLALWTLLTVHTLTFDFDAALAEKRHELRLRRLAEEPVPVINPQNLD